METVRLLTGGDRLDNDHIHSDRTDGDRKQRESPDAFGSRGSLRALPSVAC
ncbi:hypothetical protein [Halosimplex pelagicum]|uniref:Uncharacterized protein n=1 Tax=Halosimplex pelagicum TaxID=869886 RepID=A0A7D5P8Y1_9EURY|nr:hypothetical protein [Halosimplex pelagicum]QLH80362.1 hypothetical protein HZS54_01385 [Halosimplex pelagicum]